jgi:hypothetical protein
MQQVQGKYLISIPIKREIILTGNSDNEEINLTAADNDFSCVMLNSVAPTNISIPKQNKVYLKRAKLVSSLPGLLPGIITDSNSHNFTAVIYPLGINQDVSAPNVEYFGRLCFKKFDEWVDFNAELISKNNGIKDYWVPGIGDQTRINYQDSNLSSFWVGKKGALSVIAEIETAGVWDYLQQRLI